MLIKDIYVCNHCKQFNEIEIEYKGDYEVDINGVWIKCGKCNKTMYKIDNDIFPAIEILNKKGYTTIACCQGHNVNEFAYILFDINIKFIVEPPDMWKYENFMYKNKDKCVCLRPISQYLTAAINSKIKVNGKALEWREIHNKEMQSLLEWVKNLQNKEDN